MAMNRSGFYKAALSFAHPPLFLRTMAFLENYRTVHDRELFVYACQKNVFTSVPGGYQRKCDLLSTSLPRGSAFFESYCLLVSRARVQGTR